MEEPAVADTFSVPEVAEALGRPLCAIQLWISTDILPRPILREVGGDGTWFFSKGELLVLKAFIDRYAGPSALTNMRAATHEIHQAIQAYRDMYV